MKEADIARLVYLGYPTASQDIIERMAVRAFVIALNFQVVKLVSRGYARVRQIRSTRSIER